MPDSPELNLHHPAAPAVPASSPPEPPATTAAAGAGPGTAVAVAEDEGVGALPAEIRQALRLRKMQNQVAAEIAKISWGQALEVSTVRALAAWGREYNVDVITEIDLLGNKPYLNARYYLRRLGGLVDEGKVEYAVSDFVQNDERLMTLASERGPDDQKLTQTALDAQKEVTRRVLMRIKYGIPEKAAASCLFRVKLHSLSEEVVGVNWCGNNSRGKSDPVGDAEPTKTAETRAARRAMRLLVAHVPAVATEIYQTETSLEQFHPRIAADVAKLDRPSLLSGRGVRSNDYDDDPPGAA